MFPGMTTSDHNIDIEDIKILKKIYMLFFLWKFLEQGRFQITLAGRRCLLFQQYVNKGKAYKTYSDTKFYVFHLFILDIIAFFIIKSKMDTL